MYRLTSQKARTSQPRKPFSGATVRIRIIIAVLPSFSHVSPHARRLAQGKDGGRERAHVLLGGCRVAMPYRGGGEKVAGVLRWTKKVSRSVIGKTVIGKNRVKESRPIWRKRSLLEKNKKGEEERDDGKRADGRVV